MRRVLISLLVAACVGVGFSETQSEKLAYTLFKEFLQLPKHPDYLKNCKHGEWLHIIADPSRGEILVKKLGVARTGQTATLWMLTDPASMSGRLGLYTVKFRSIGGDRWLPVDGLVNINAPEGLPKADVARCTIPVR